MADPGFPGRRGANPRGVCVKLLLIRSTIVAKKLHKNDKIWAEGGASLPPLDPPLGYDEYSE